MLLAGDIGGTKTQLAVFSQEKGAREALAEKQYASSAYPNLESMVQAFMAEFQLPVERAVFGVAGPVVGGQASITNLPWMIRETRLRELLGIENVTLLNDLQSIAYAVPYLSPQDLQTLNHAEPVVHGPIAVIAPGTGLGEAYLTWNGTRYQAFASEGGHADFGPTDALELGLLRYMLQR
ncbi:MAG: glucokinase, partial [Anaerolineae bacterium]|nr:glucokinase [Anaerolineae bacterium]